MSSNVDLNALRTRILANQNSGTTRTAEPAKAVMVDKEGKIRLGDQQANQSGPESVVPQETFAGRREDDRATAARYMPNNTQELTTDEGVQGFLYTFNTELQDEYTLFAFFDGSNYQVQVVNPEVEARFNSPHTGHIFSNGRICFGNEYGSGMPTLRDAYSKSVLWANGMSAAVKTGTFPFSKNNL